jgi:hypothetical protein
MNERRQMKLSRRVFLSFLMVPRPRSSSMPVEVLETFNNGHSAIALLVHHADSQSRQLFSDWLHEHSPADIWVRSDAGQEVGGKIFRVRMCFGRGLILLNSSMRLREHERVTVTFTEQMRVK